MVAVDKCATTPMASMKLVADDGATSTTKIATTDYSKDTHGKCSMLGFDVKWDANKGDIVFLTKSVVLETVPASIASLSAFSPRMITDIKRYTLMPTRYSAKCSGSNNSQVVSYLSFLSTPMLVESAGGHLLVPWQLLLQHFEVDPWPPITSRDQEFIIWESQLMSWLAFNCSCSEVHILPPWPPPTEAKWFQLFVGKQFSLVNPLNIIHVMLGPLVWDPGDGKVHLHKILIWMDDWFPQHYFHWKYILWSNELRLNVGVKSELSFLINLIAATSKEGMYAVGELEYLLSGLSFVEMERKDNCYLSWSHLLLARVMVVELSSTGQFGSMIISFKGKHVTS